MTYVLLNITNSNIGEIKRFAAMVSVLVMIGVIWYHLSNLKNVKNSHGGLLSAEKWKKFNNTNVITKHNAITISCNHKSIRPNFSLIKHNEIKKNCKHLNKVETRSSRLFITGCSNSFMSCDDNSIYQFLFFFLHSARDYSCFT